jgi:uncharacterized paraquat-inducible protein A
MFWRWLGFRSLLEDVGQFAVILVGVGFVLRLLHRWGARDDLRQALLAQGVPVCLRCGYCLRGHAADAPCCPECGRALHDRVRAMLSREPETPAAARLSEFAADGRGLDRP